MTTDQEPQHPGAQDLVGTPQPVEHDDSPKLEFPKLFTEATELVLELRDTLLATPDTREAMAETFFNSSSARNRIKISRGHFEYSIEYDTFSGMNGTVNDGGISQGKASPEELEGLIVVRIDRVDTEDPTRVERGHVRIVGLRNRNRLDAKLGDTSIDVYTSNIEEAQGKPIENPSENTERAASRFRGLISEIAHDFKRG